jgi:Flp pilus assembly protein TadD
MKSSPGRALVAAVACLILLGGCETSTKFSDLIGVKSNGEPTGSLPAATAPGDPAATGSLAAAGAGPPAAAPGLLGSDPNDDLSLGKRHYRAGNFGIAEGHFRQAVELHPRDAEAWVGLAASYDRLRRFELADRAYKQAIEIVGPTPEVLNNQGYSYMLRGDYARARQTLRIAQAKDPSSPYIKNNLDLLEKSVRSGKAIQ